MPFNLRGKVALVTGAAAGLGRAFSQALGQAGADLVCTDINRESLDKTVKLLGNYGYQVLQLISDVSQPQDAEDMVNETISRFGHLDIAVNNAGIIHKPYRLHELPLEEWNRLIDIDLTGVFLCMQNELKAMVRQRNGNIINITSVLGMVGLDPELMPRASYIAAKHGVIGLTRQAALEYASDNIRVNAIAPGWFAGTNLSRERLADRTAEEFQQREDRITKLIPMRRRGKVDELNGLLLYLASDDSSYITGQVFTVDGGWTAH